MNILLVSTDNSEVINVGGKHIHQELLEAGWKKGGHTVITAYPLFTKEKGPSLFDRVRAKLISMIGWDRDYEVFTSLISKLVEEMVEKVVAAISENNIDYISVQDVVAACAVKRAFQVTSTSLPVCMTLHGYFARENQNYSGYKGKSRDRIFEDALSYEREALAFVSGVMTVDTRIKEYIVEQHNCKAPIKVLYNAIDTDRFHLPEEGERVLSFETTGFSDKNLNLIVTRRLVPKNGVRYAIEAINLLKEESLNVKLHIIGDGPEEAMLQDMVTQNKLSDMVEFIGMVPHKLIDAYYKATDVVLMPSTRSDDIEEATSLSMLEGMACGKVVIASAIGGMKEVIQHGENGLLVEDKRPDQIAELIKTLLKDSSYYNELAKKSAIYALQKHGYVNHAAELFEFYTQLKSVSIEKS